MKMQKKIVVMIKHLAAAKYFLPSFPAVQANIVKSTSMNATQILVSIMQPVQTSTMAMTARVFLASLVSGINNGTCFL